MEYRSTNTNFVHFTGDVTAAVDSSHGVQLTGGSTGGIVQAVGDDANVSLTVRGQGTGRVTIGNSSQAFIVGGTLGVTGNSTLTGTLKIGTGETIKGIYSTTFTAQFAGLSSGQIGEATLSTATGDFAVGDLVCIDATVTPAGAVMTGWRMAADATTRVTMSISVPGSSAASTGRVVGRITWLDIT